MENQLMLDAKELAKRITSAMDGHNPPIRQIDLAAQCDVSPQAVHSWRTTGRVAKRHLQTIAEITGQPIEFFLEGRRGESRQTKNAWLRIGAPLALLFALLLPPFSADDARASFSSRVASLVYYGKSLLRRILTKLQGLRATVA
jgi:hypothetical protein